MDHGVCMHQRMQRMAARIPAMMKQAMRVLHLLGLAAYFGCVLAVLVLTWAGSAEGDWERIASVRSDVLRLLQFIAIPGSALAMLSGGALMWKRLNLLKWSVMQAKLALVMLMMIHTGALVMPTAARLVQLAREAGTSSTAAASFDLLLQREHWLGGVNVLLFLAILILSVRLTSPAKRNA